MLNFTSKAQMRHPDRFYLYGELTQQKKYFRSFVSQAQALAFWSFGCAFGLAAAASNAGLAQDLMRNLDLNSPAFTEAELSREDVVQILQQPGAARTADFAGKSLNAIDLSGLDLSKANFRSARLNKTSFKGSNLEGAILDQAWMISAELSGANLKGASLFQTQLTTANLDGADLSGARVAADLTRASLKGAKLGGADLSADMRNQSMGLMRGVLKSADLTGADFSHANLARTDLEFATLRNANMTGADLTGAELGGADLTGANVTGASFADADLDSARLIDLTGKTEASFEKARNIKAAIWQ